MKLPLILIFLCSICYSQNEFNNWYFGSNLGLNFSTPIPSLIGGGQINQAEGNATISDASGNLLFYTSGTTVYNRLHAVMTNGSGLLGHPSSTQSAIIVQKPWSANIYYIFTADADVGLNGIRLSEVDMNLSGTLGSVTAIKNVQLQTASCEKLTAIRHCNNRDVWVVSHDWNSNTFRSWLVSPTGVSAAVTSNAGYVPIAPIQQAYGQMKANSQGDMIACAYYGTNSQISGNRVEIYGFNKSSGQVTSATNLGTVNGAYGVEFSQSGRYLYASTNPGYLYQWDLCASNIQGSKYLVSNMGAFGGSLQIAKDGKIYMVRGVNKWISRITNPEIYGGGCGFIDQYITTTTNSNFGLPNFAPYYVNLPLYPFLWTNTGCGIYCFEASQYNQSCNIQTQYQFEWHFEDGVVLNGANVCRSFGYSSYQDVKLIRTSLCTTDSITLSGTILANEINALLTIN
jgi:hypothetical protein